MSRGFAAALTGIGMTLLAWFGPWAWPAWPAFTATNLVFGKGGFSELPHAQKVITVVMLVVVNSGFWGVIAYALGSVVRRVLFSRRA